MATNKTQKQSLSASFTYESITLWQIAANSGRQQLDYAHRNNSYVFIFLEQGYAKMAVDFEECTLQASSVMVLLPGQVHLPIESEAVGGWALIVDKALVHAQHRKQLQQASPQESRSCTPEQASDLKDCLLLLNRRMGCPPQPNVQEVIQALTSACIGMIATLYRKEEEYQQQNRPAAITAQFRSLLTANYKTMKKPMQYAEAINISPIYLNEIIKKTMGITVGAAIQNEIVVQAKRLLYYTNLSIKEVARELGYDDWAYFTRLFTKRVSLPPLRFRSKFGNRPATT